MHKSVITATFKTDIQTLWDVVTDNTDWSWRKDLSKIEIEDDTHFIEYTTDGYPTHFTITAKEPLKRYAFDIKNDHTEGKWLGLFRELPDGGTEIEFTEEINLGRPMIELMCRILKPYKKMQERYVYNLKTKLGEI